MCRGFCSSHQFRYTVVMEKGWVLSLQFTFGIIPKYMADSIDQFITAHLDSFKMFGDAVSMKSGSSITPGIT